MDPLVGHIELSLPPDSRYMRLARLMASGVASTCGLPLEEVEDFRITVDELCSTLIEMGDGQPIRLAFDLHADELVVLGRTVAGDEGAIDDERLALSSQILEVVADGHDLSALDGHVEFSARKVVRGGGVG
jgi:anti-sigma regulatory factor (Ser/Thr protein kinase)